MFRQKKTSDAIKMLNNACVKGSVREKLNGGKGLMR